MTNKLAVLISGSYRNFDAVWPLNESSLKKCGIPYEVYMHTWSANPSLSGDILQTEFRNRFYFSLFPRKYSKFLGQINQYEIKKKYNFRFIQVDDFDEKVNAKKFNLATAETNTRYQLDLNSCGMYLGINVLRQQIIGTQEFTHFLRLRPDFILDDTVFPEMFLSDLSFFGQLLDTEEGLIGDQCFGGKIATSGFLLNANETLEEITNTQSWINNERFVLAENVMRIRLKPFRENLNINYFSGSGKIQRPDVVIIFNKMSFVFIWRVLSHNWSVLFIKLNQIARLLKK